MDSRFGRGYRELNDIIKFCFVIKFSYTHIIGIEFYKTLFEANCNYLVYFILSRNYLHT